MLTVQSTASEKFTTPTIPKDGSYTFYLGDYNVETKTISPSADLNPVTVCFESGGAIIPAVEITLVKSTSVKKYVVDDPSSTRISGDGVISASVTSCFDGLGFSYTIPALDLGADQFLLVRVLYAPTKLFFSRVTNLPIQGRTVSSEAKSSTSTGVSKKVVLFQSYPQIPGEFFTTAF